MNNLLLINKNIQNYQEIVNVCNDYTNTICYDEVEDTYESLINTFTDLSINNISNLGIVSHNSTEPSFIFLKKESSMILGNTDSELTTWTDFINFIKSLNLKENSNFDFIACPIFRNGTQTNSIEPLVYETKTQYIERQQVILNTINWQLSLNKLEEKLTKINIRLSDNNNSNLTPNNLKRLVSNWLP